MPCPLGGETNAAGTLISGRRAIRRGGDKVNYHLGVSGFATHAVLDARSVVPVPADVPADVASLLGCAVLTGGGAVLNAGRPAEGATVMVIGLGGVGMAALMTAVGLGGRTVIGVDAVAAKRSWAPTRCSARSRPWRARPAPTSSSRLSAGRQPSRRRSPRQPPAEPPSPSPSRRRTTSPGSARSTLLPAAGPSSAATSAPPCPRATSRSSSRWGRLPVERLISATIPLDEVNEAMDQLADGTALRQLVRP